MLKLMRMIPKSGLRFSEKDHALIKAIARYFKLVV
jgi:hypothetical protein